MLSGRILIGKILLLTTGMHSAMTLGREGPSVHVGSAMMHMITKWVRCPMHLVRRGMILGGGAGVAAAFNAPLAGLGEQSEAQSVLVDQPPAPSQK